LKTLPEQTLRETLSADFTSKLIKQGGQEYRDALQSKLNTATCLYLKAVGGLSRQKYTTADRILFCTFDAEQSKWVRGSFKDVVHPRLSSRHMLDKLRKEFKDQFGMQTFAGVHSSSTPPILPLVL